MTLPKNPIKREESSHKYKVIYADPPWRYRSKAGGSWISGSAAKYPTMSLDEICAMKVPEIADPSGSVIFLWTTTPFLVDGSALTVMKEWGFTPKTAIYWNKLGRLGMGFWFRGGVEMCLVGIRGKVKAFRCQNPNVITSKPCAHSQKPDDFFKLINPVLDAHGLSPRVELFCRGFPWCGWDGWGAECLNGVTLDL